MNTLTKFLSFVSEMLIILLSVLCAIITIMTTYGTVEMLRFHYVLYLNYYHWFGVLLLGWIIVTVINSSGKAFLKYPWLHSFMVFSTITSGVLTLVYEITRFILRKTITPSSAVLYGSVVAILVIWRLFVSIYFNKHPFIQVSKRNVYTSNRRKK